MKERMKMLPLVFLTVHEFDGKFLVMNDDGEIEGIFPDQQKAERFVSQLSEEIGGLR